MFSLDVEPELKLKSGVAAGAHLSLKFRAGAIAI